MNASPTKTRRPVRQGLHQQAIASCGGFLAAICLLVGTAVTGARAARPLPPNIIVIMTDEHNASVMGCAGDKVARTPHLDALAERGVLFDAHYCASPICTPSRQSFTTGKYVSGHRVWSNTPGVPEGTPSLARILNAAGYDSYLNGKMHYKGGMTHGYQIISEKDGRITPGKEPGAERAARGSNAIKPRQRLAAGRFEDRGDELGEEFEHAGEHADMDEFVDVVRRDHAIKFLKERGADNNKPFFLTIGFIAPHYPLVAPPEYLEHFRDKVPFPEVPPGYVDTLPLNYRHLRNDRKFERVPPALAKRALEGYYARVEWIDDQIGMVLEALKNSRFAENTVVIYTSDHGENLGEHGLWWKNCMFDSGARVPLIVSWPSRWKGGQHRTGACGVLDLVQTIAAIGGAQVPSDWKGVSMIPWLDDHSAPWRDLAVSEYYASYVASGFAMIRQGDWKYVYHTRADELHGPERELYNLREDPRELHNLAGKEENMPRMEAMHKAMVEETGEDPEVTEARWRAGETPEVPRS
ncbi:sulfatase-like hydrolase/transferase [Verrucomicrobium spinosum]|uniref:sulfatase-like hydrolase/transferase n=1 Tax=Verrucomicrobium spinosum TaxID=2736 RepID=UPI0009D74764|nr:sulfatase-like hydrolase/transferase [Verrucomicrobium spinosum]